MEGAACGGGGGPKRGLREAERRIVRERVRESEMVARPYLNMRATLYDTLCSLTRTLDRAPHSPLTHSVKKVRNCTA